MTDAQSPDFSNDIDAVGKSYPTLQPTLQNTVVQQGTPSGPNDDRQLEFYHPWETDNPNPGKVTVQIFNQGMTPEDRQSAIAGDLLHHLGAVDPATGQPVDPRFYGLKQQLSAARNPQHLQMDQAAYERDKASPYGAGDYSDWDTHSRLDAYVRAGLFPNQNQEWQGAVSNPQMQTIFQKMRNYLTGSQQQ
jgi:hypothetical protein